jgi:hypothetical protein
MATLAFHSTPNARLVSAIGVAPFRGKTASPLVAIAVKIEPSSQFSTACCSPPTAFQNAMHRPT